MERRASPPVPGPRLWSDSPPESPRETVFPGPNTQPSEFQSRPVRKLSAIRAACCVGSSSARVGTDAFVRPSQAKRGRFPSRRRESLILQAQEKKGQTRCDRRGERSQASSRSSPVPEGRLKPHVQNGRPHRELFTTKPMFVGHRSTSSVCGRLVVCGRTVSGIPGSPTSRAPVPQGRLKIARRFKAGLANRNRRKSRRDDRK